MGNLEHNIKEAFEKQDAATKVADKTAMWNRLDSAMHSRKGVASIWRVAAVFLGLLLTAGVFASIQTKITNDAKVKKLEAENIGLAGVIDSLNSVTEIQKPVEIKWLEKEKVVYKDRVVYKTVTNDNPALEKKNAVLLDSLKEQNLQEKNYKHEIELLKQSLEKAQNELAALKTSESKDNTTTAPFELKSERVELGVSKSPSIKNQEMKMKVFQKNFLENRNNLNQTIFNR